MPISVIPGLDHHRALRKGYPEVIYGAGKTTGQICDIVSAMLVHGNNILITRVAADVFDAVLGLTQEARFHETAKIITVKKRETPVPPTSIAVVTAGTSDIPVAEEAAVPRNFSAIPSTGYSTWALPGFIASSIVWM